MVWVKVAMETKDMEIKVTGTKDMATKDMATRDTETRAVTGTKVITGATTRVITAATETRAMEAVDWLIWWAVLSTW